MADKESNGQEPFALNEMAGKHHAALPILTATPKLVDSMEIEHLVKNGDILCSRAVNTSANDNMTTPIFAMANTVREPVSYSVRTATPQHLANIARIVQNQSGEAEVWAVIGCVSSDFESVDAQQQAKKDESTVLSRCLCPHHCGKPGDPSATMNLPELTEDGVDQSKLRLMHAQADLFRAQQELNSDRDQFELERMELVIDARTLRRDCNRLNRELGEVKHRENVRVSHLQKTVQDLHSRLAHAALNRAVR